MLFLKTPFLQRDDSNVHVTVKTQPDNLGYFREFAGFLDDFFPVPEEGHGHVLSSTFTGEIYPQTWVATHGFHL